MIVMPNISRKMDIRNLNCRKSYVIEHGVGAVFVGTIEQCFIYMSDNRYRHTSVPEVASEAH
jgi:hypothetical protein